MSAWRYNHVWLLGRAAPSRRRHLPEWPHRCSYTPTVEAGRHLCSPELGDHQAAVAVLTPALRLDAARRPNAIVRVDCTWGNSNLEASQLCQAPEASMGELSYCKHPRLKLNMVYMLCWEVMCHYTLPHRCADLGLHQRGDSCTVLCCAKLLPRACLAALASQPQSRRRVALQVMLRLL